MLASRPEIAASANSLTRGSAASGPLVVQTGDRRTLARRASSCPLYATRTKRRNERNDQVRRPWEFCQGPGGELRPINPGCSLWNSCTASLPASDPFIPLWTHWTRVSPQLPPDAHRALDNLTVGWSVYDTDGSLAQLGVALTTGDHDWTVKLVAEHLTHGREYTFRFRHGPSTSPTGRFRLPPPRTAGLASLSYGIFTSVLSVGER